jgi:hypothetical protein
MIPGVSLPKNSRIRTPVALKLKPRWQFDSRRRIFRSESGEKFTPRGDLPKNTKIVYKVPSLTSTSEAKLSKYEKDLRRYMQVILPAGKSPADYVDIIRTWPSVAEAHVEPEVSLPQC